MSAAPAASDASFGSDALLAAYQLLIETTLESGDDDVMLQRSLMLLSSIRWPEPHRLYSILLPTPDSGSLRLAAYIGDLATATPPCDDLKAVACLCGRALVRPGRLLCFKADAATGSLPCDPQGTGIHLVLPLSSRGRVQGVLHVLIASDNAPGELEQSFLAQVATLLAASLHRRRSEREHDRLEMQFLQAQKMEAVGRLAGGVAHDFNNILTAITNYADLGLLKLPSESPLIRNFEEIIAASERAALLTQQLLAFSRRQVLSPRVIDVNAVIAELGKALRRLLGAGFELSIGADAALARIMADPALIEQLIINLAVSARDAMPLRGSITIATANVEFDASYTLDHPDVAPGAYVRLAIGAIGPGMVPEFLEALGRPVSSSPEHHAGVSLGSTAVRDIIQQCGGHVRIGTAADSGITASIYFPAIDDAAGGAPARGGNFDLPRGGETILLAEDDDSVRVVMGEVLRDLGYHLLEAREGREALAIAAGHAGPIDLLLTDVVLPGFGGSELLRRLCPTRPGLRVLYITGVMDDAVLVRDVSEPGAGFLQKPFSPWVLASRLRQVLDAPPSSP